MRTRRCLGGTSFAAMAAAAVGAGALLWMRDRSRAPLRSACACMIHQAMQDPAHQASRRRELERDAA